MAWLRIDDGLTANGKIVQLTDGEFRVWMRLLCYCARVQDPSVDGVTKREVSGLSAARIRRFADVALLDAVSGSSPRAYEVHDWAKYLPRDATNHERQARWRARNSVTSTVTTTVTDTVMQGVTETVTESAEKALRLTRAAEPVPVPQEQNPPTATETVELATPPGHGSGTADLEPIWETIKTEAARLAPAAAKADDDIPF